MIQDVINWMVIFAIVLTLPVIIFNFLTQGFLFTYLKVFSSRGKYVLAKIRSPTGTYVRKATITGDEFHYSVRHPEKKLRKRIGILPENAVKQFLLVKCVEVDESTGAIILTNMEAVEGYDGSKVDSIVTRTAMLPKLDDKTQLRALVLVAILAIVISAFSAFLAYQNGLAIAELASKLGNI